MPLSLLGHQRVPRGPVLQSAGMIRMSDGNSLKEEGFKFGFSQSQREGQSD